MIATESKPAMKIGAQVRLNSGGPIMTVVGIDAAGQIECEWKRRDGTRNSGTFPVACLASLDTPA